MDVACLNDIDGYVLSAMGVLADVTEAEVPRLRQVLPVFRKPSTVPHIYSALVVLYNPAKVRTAPKWPRPIAGRNDASQIAVERVPV